MTPDPTSQRLPALAPARARQLIAAFPGKRVLVIGDVMLDRFLVGRVSRISPEAPVPVVHFDHDMSRVGGAANVAGNVAGLGGSAHVVGVTGDDEAATRLVEACGQAGLVTSFVTDVTRPTTTKVRIVTERNLQVARVDYEVDREISGNLEDTIAEAIHLAFEQADVAIISDYLKGTITRRIMNEVIALARGRGLPVLVDPKIPHLAYYAGAALITPNHHEAEAATHLRVREHADARQAARMFRDQSRCAAVLMTRGDQGMWLLDGEAEGHLPATAREVADVTGAGDTVIATLALALAAGATTAEGAWLANEAAGIVVGKFGPATATPTELLQALQVGRGRGEGEGG